MLFMSNQIAWLCDLYLEYLRVSGAAYSRAESGKRRDDIEQPIQMR